MFKSFLDSGLHYLRVKYIPLLLFMIALLFPTQNVIAQVYEGTLILETQEDVDAFNYTSVIGSIRIDDGHTGSIKNLDALSTLTSISNNLVFFFTDSLHSVEGLSNLTFIGGALSFRFTGIQNVDGLSNLTSVRIIWFDNNYRLTDLDGLLGVTTLDTLLVIGNRSLTSLNGFSNLSGVMSDLAIGDNQLTNLDALSGITSITDSLLIGAEDYLTNLDGLSNILTIGGNLRIYYNSSIKSFCGLYPLLNNNGLSGSYIVHGNSFNPTAQQIIDCGPCSSTDDPVANAGTNKTVVAGGTVTLNGSGSSDPNNNTLSYKWALVYSPFGSTATLSSTTVVSPTFIADSTGYYLAELTVFNGCELSFEDTVVFTAVTIQTATQNMTTTIQGLPLGSGNKNALISKLQNALAKYNSGDWKSAKNILLSFINQVNQFVTSGYITQAQAQPLIDYANQIIAAINVKLGIAKETDLKQLPENFSLMQNYPNPFNPNTVIQWQIPVDSRVTLKVYDILGKEVAVLFDGDKPAGYYESEFNAANLASGIYFYKIEAGSFIQTKKLILLK